MDVLSGIRSLTLPVLTATLLGCVEQQGLVEPDDVNTEEVQGQQTPIGIPTGMSLRDRAHNHLTCMSAYNSVLSPCVDMAANHEEAERLNRELSKITLETDYHFRTVTADDVGSACVGRLTNGVFGANSDTRNPALLGHTVSSYNRPERRYDWAEDGIGEQVQSLINQVYARPDTEAPKWLERTVGRLVGHTHHGMLLLAQAGFEKDQRNQLIDDYNSSGDNNLLGQHPDEQDDEYKIKACLEYL